MANISTEVILTAKEELDQALNKANNVIPQIITDVNKSLDDIDKKLEETKELVDGAGAASKQDVEEVKSSLEHNTNELVKETKKETILPISGSNLVFRGIRKVRSSTSFGSDFFFTEGENNVIMNCDIESASNGIIFGNEAYNSTPKKMKALFNKIKANSGNRARNGTDGTIDGEHDWFMNDIETTTREVGIENWTGKTRIAFNRIVNVEGNGGHSGITMGKEGHQKALFNYVDGFAYGIEVGNSKRDVLIHGNSVENSDTGISCSSTGKEKTINISYNYIKLKKEGIGISVSGAETLNISNCIIEYESDGNYNDVLSRSGVGIELITNLKHININNCIFINIETPIKGSGKFTRVDNCMFFNVGDINKGVAYDTVYSECYFENFKSMTHYAINNGFLKIKDSTFILSDDNININSFAFNGRGNAVTSLLVSENNSFINCKENPMVSNSEAGDKDIRASIFCSNGIYYTYAQPSFSAIKTLCEKIGLSVTVGMKFCNNNNKIMWEVLENGKHLTRQANIPTSGEFLKGDIVYNNTPSSGGYIGWVCITSGSPGVWKGFGLIS